MALLTRIGNVELCVQAATIAAELLSGGTSPTADAIAKKSVAGLSNGSHSTALPQPLPQLPTSGEPETLASVHKISW